MTQNRDHVKCRGPVYAANPKQSRFPVPDGKVKWSDPYPEYQPASHTLPKILACPPWADPDVRSDTAAAFKWNAIDGKSDRRSYMGVYSIVGNVPRNPVGRTGLAGRGTLGKWGPNHAADPIVTRWKRDEDGNVVTHPESGKPVLQFVAILRQDCSEWALPGGMVDPGEHVTATLKREFGEEALNTLTASDEEREAILGSVEELFEHGVEVYKGYVDDPRNTDNAWMETAAYNYHDEEGTSAGKMPLSAGDDAKGVRWTDIGSELNLYASHVDFLQRVAERHDAHW